jgi:hypothetical protein
MVVSAYGAYAHVRVGLGGCLADGLPGHRARGSEARCASFGTERLGRGITATQQQRSDGAARKRWQQRGSVTRLHEVGCDGSRR